jgi:hypothetical protein
MPGLSWLWEDQRGARYLPNVAIIYHAGILNAAPRGRAADGADVGKRRVSAEIACAARIAGHVLSNLYRRARTRWRGLG